MSNPVVPQPITDQIRDDIKKLVIREIRRGIETNFNAVQDPAGFLASTGAAPPTLQLSKELARGACRAWARGATPIQGPLVDGVYGPLCRPYLASIAEEPGSGDVSGPVPGGQCVGVPYGARYSWNQVSGSTISYTPGSLQFDGVTLYGPLTYQGRQPAGTGNLNRFVVSGFTSTGTPAVGALNRGGVFSRVNLDDVITGLQFERLTGTGECGDQPEGYLPPQTRPALPTPVVINPTSRGFNLPPLEIGIDADGNIVVNVPDLGFEFTVPNPLEEDPGSPEDDTPTNPGEGGDPEETGEGGESSGCAPEGSELTGVFVEILNFPENAARFQNNSRQPFRGAGYIAMGWPNLLGVDISGGVINLEQFFHAQQRGVTCWRVTANTGFELRCTPYYRELNPEEEEE